MMILRVRSGCKTPNPWHGSHCRRLEPPGLTRISGGMKVSQTWGDNWQEKLMFRVEQDLFTFSLKSLKGLCFFYIGPQRPVDQYRWSIIRFSWNGFIHIPEMKAKGMVVLSFIFGCVLPLFRGPTWNPGYVWWEPGSTTIWMRLNRTWDGQPFRKPSENWCGIQCNHVITQVFCIFL